MFNYKIYNNYLKSDIEFFQLLEAAEAKDADITLKLEKFPDEIIKEIEENKKFVNVDKKCTWFCNHKGRFLIRDGKAITVWNDKNVSNEEMHPFILGYCMAILFWQRNMVAVHCSAIENNGKATLISGGSGSGKSTLTTCFLENGSRLVSDDVVILSLENDKIMVLPAFPQQKLCRDAVVRKEYDIDNLFYIDEDKDKFAVARRDRFYSEPLPLERIVCLNKSSKIEEPVLTPIEGHDKLKKFIENLFLIAMFEQDGGMDETDMMTALMIAGKADMVKLLRPETGDTTKKQRELLLDL